jgi:hypothetical protein
MATENGMENVLCECGWDSGDNTYGVYAFDRPRNPIMYQCSAGQRDIHLTQFMTRDDAERLRDALTACIKAIDEVAE